MEIKTLIEASADVVRIVKLHEGSVYKRMNTEYSGGKAELLFGVVQTIMSNGVDAGFTAIEFTTDGYAPKAATVCHRDITDLALFPATPAEISVHFAELAEQVARKVAVAERDLMSAQSLQRSVTALLDGSAAMSAPATTLSLTASTEEN